jgi:ATP-dependent Clp protease ATP-binding subunit ClpA
MPRVELLTQNGRPAGQLESRLRHLVIGQKQAIRQIVRAYHTYLAGLSPVGRPIANFLFLGPTGSGKTRIVVATAESLLQNSRAVIKIDYTEFQHSHEIAKFDRVALEARYRAPARATIVEPDGQRPDSRRRLHPREPRGRVSCSRVWP